MDKNKIILSKFLEIADHILESSSSSDEEEFGMVLETPEPVPKVLAFEEMVDTFTDLQFKKHFRMTRRTFAILLDKYSQHLKNTTTHTGGHVQTSPKKDLLSFIWYAGNNCCMRDIANRFDVAESTFDENIMKRVMTFLLNIAPTIIRFPSDFEGKMKISEEFERICGFPGVIGCIDGTYITIQTPAHKIKSTYINRHDGVSITLQGICDAKRRFLDVFTGTPSKIHDSRIYSLSFISKKIEEICEGTFHIIGDAAYSLREYLLTPVRDYGGLSEDEKRYNFKHAQTRVRIENAFGILKQRFRQLIRLEFKSVDRMTQFVISVCVLHNLCIDADDLWEYCEDIIATPDADVEMDDTLDPAARDAGQIKREQIISLLR